MAHRKVIELTVKVVIDVDNDDFPDRSENSEEYERQLENACDDFSHFCSVNVGSTSNVTVKGASVTDWTPII